MSILSENDEKFLIVTEDGRDRVERRQSINSTLPIRIFYISITILLNIFFITATYIINNRQDLSLESSLIIMIFVIIFLGIIDVTVYLIYGTLKNLERI